MVGILHSALAADLAAEVACCACSSVCGLFVKHQEERAKLFYFVLHLVNTALMGVFVLASPKTTAHKTSVWCTSPLPKNLCDVISRSQVPYVFSMALTAFHLTFLVTSAGVSRCDSWRAKLHNGLFSLKLLLYFGLLWFSFWVPKREEVERWWYYIGFSGGVLFMLYQIAVVLDFGASWSNLWIERLDVSPSRLWYFFTTLTAVALLVAVFGILLLMMLLFTDGMSVYKCRANVTYLCTVTTLFIVALVAAFLRFGPQLAFPCTMQCSVMFLYASTLIWFALSLQPDRACNALIRTEVPTLLAHYGSVLGLLVGYGCLLFAFFFRSPGGVLQKSGLSLSTRTEDLRAPLSGVGDTASQRAGYSYPFLHLVLALHGLYNLVTILQWSSIGTDSKGNRNSWSAVWIHMSASIVALLVFVWTLVSPMIPENIYVVLLPESRLSYEQPTEQPMPDVKSLKPTPVYEAIETMPTIPIKTKKTEGSWKNNCDQASPLTKKDNISRPYPDHDSGEHVDQRQLDFKQRSPRSSTTKCGIFRSLFSKLSGVAVETSKKSFEINNTKNNVKKTMNKDRSVYHDQRWKTESPVRCSALPNSPPDINHIQHYKLKPREIAAGMSISRVDKVYFSRSHSSSPVISDAVSPVAQHQAPRKTKTHAELWTNGGNSPPRQTDYHERNRRRKLYLNTARSKEIPSGSRPCPDFNPIEDRSSRNSRADAPFRGTKYQSSDRRRWRPTVHRRANAPSSYEDTSQGESDKEFRYRTRYPPVTEPPYRIQSRDSACRESSNPDRYPQSMRTSRLAEVKLDLAEESPVRTMHMSRTAYVEEVNPPYTTIERRRRMRIQLERIRREHEVPSVHQVGRRHGDSSQSRVVEDELDKPRRLSRMSDVGAFYVPPRRTHNL